MRIITSIFFALILFSFVYVHPSFALLAGFNSGCLEDPNWTPSHVATLTIKKGAAVPTIDTKTWIFVCITKGTQTYCTTGGTGDGDTELFGSMEHFNTLKGIATDLGGVKTGSNPSMTNGDATNPQFNETIRWGDAYPTGVIHQWSWVQAAVPAGGAGAGGEMGAQQQADLIFERISDDTKKCAKISWDPRGVVFDINTMYPVKGAIVELYKKNITSTYDFVPNQLGIVNPYTTNITNGQYSFFVDEGWYKLKLKGGSISPLTATQKIIANNMFIDVSGEDHVYTDDIAIFEKRGTVEIANIPVKVINESSLIKDLNILDNVSPTLEGDSIRLFGRVSHPKSKMIITMSMLNDKEETKQFVKVDYTDGLGEYDKLISQTVESEEPLVFQGATLSFELNSFYKTGVFSKKNNNNHIAQFIQEIWESALHKFEANAAVSVNTIQIKPMPTYIEGIAYDEKGIPIPKAIIGIYPFFSQKPYYLTLADENGRYKIGAQHIPQFEYNLRYKKLTGEVLVVDTTTFIQQNAKLIIEEEIKPYSAKKTTLAQDKKIETYFAGMDAPVELKTSEEKQRAITQSNNTQNTTSKTGKPGVSTSGSSSREVVVPTLTPQASTPTRGGAGIQGIIMVIVVLLILVMIGIGAFIMMKSKQQSTSQY